MEFIKNSKNSGNSKDGEKSKKIPDLYINICLSLLIATEGVYGIIDADILWDKIWWGIVTSVICFNVLKRKPATHSDQRWWVWPLCFISTFHFLAFDYSEESKWSFWALTALVLAGDLSLLYLGRCFSILPALRTIKTGFLYKYLRHPVYATYIVGDWIYFSINLSIWNAMVAVVSSLLFAYRCHLEENVLMLDPSYLKYAVKTKWRLVPGIY